MTWNSDPESFDSLVSGRQVARGPAATSVQSTHRRMRDRRQAVACRSAPRAQEKRGSAVADLAPLPALLSRAVDAAQVLAVLHRRGLLQGHADAAATSHRAPEQAGRTGRAVDQRTDLYAPGTALYEQATGRRPFDERDPLRLVHAQLTQRPTPPSSLRAELPDALSEIIGVSGERTGGRNHRAAYAMCSMPSGRRTQECMRSS